MVSLYNKFSVNGSILLPLNDFPLYLMVKSKHEVKKTFMPIKWDLTKSIEQLFLTPYTELSTIVGTPLLT